MKDTIYRQAAIDAHYEYCNKHPDAGFPVWSLKILEYLPTAQPERESIKWIPHESIFGGPDERVYTCDKCGYNIGFHVENFCPNCGGKYERYEKKEGER